MSDKILRLPEVRDRTGLPTSTIYYLINRNEFPKQTRLGCRQLIIMDIAGILARRNWALAETELFVKAICKAAKDNNVSERIASVKATYDKVASGEPCTGLPSLEQKLGRDVVTKFTEFLDITDAITAHSHGCIAEQWDLPKGIDPFTDLANAHLRILFDWAYE